MNRYTIGNYGGSSVSLSGTSDAVNIFESDGTPVTGVSFGADTESVSFDNAAGASGSISTLSVVGTNGAFDSYAVGPTTGVSEVGSPGRIAAPVPEPASLSLLALGGIALLKRRRAK